MAGPTCVLPVVVSEVLKLEPSSPSSDPSGRDQFHVVVLKATVGLPM
jgi:hypothetical protein